MLIIGGLLFLANIGNVSPLYADDHYISISEDGVVINENCEPLTSAYFSNEIPITETNTCLRLTLDYGSSVNKVQVMPVLQTGMRSYVLFQDVIEIRIDGEYQKTISTDRWTEFDVENAKTITATFPEQLHPITKKILLYSSEESVNIDEIVPDDVFDEELFNLRVQQLEKEVDDREDLLKDLREEIPPEENLRKFLQFVDWVSLSIGVTIGLVMELFLEISLFVTKNTPA